MLTWFPSPLAALRPCAAKTRNRLASAERSYEWLVVAAQPSIARAFAHLDPSLCQIILTMRQ